MSNSAFLRRRSTALVACAVATAALGSVAIPASAAPQPAYVVHSFSAVGTETGPDDITRLGDTIYVAFQNGVGSMGEASKSGATASTIQQYSLSGVPGRSWSVTGKVDGLTADAEHHRLLATTNEDGNSSFHTIDPKTSTVTDYTYKGLTHGGGTDAIAVRGDSVIISASAPSGATGPAAYTVKLSEGEAILSPLFGIDATATSANAATAGRPVKLALTDPDSNLFVPRSAARFGGAFMLDGQADQQLVFAHRADDGGQSLSVLSVPQPLDDTAFATRSKRTLWVTDPTHDKVDMITGPFAAGQAVSSVVPDGVPASLDALGLKDGSLTPIAGLTSVTPKGLLFTTSTAGEDHDDQGDDQGNQRGDD